MNTRVIAFYLPQYYPTKENDEWWSKGFTEWTNVGRAKPLFKGHYQPKVPADLGYYDLRLPEIREEQAKLAKEAGIEGFCYWHYWFNGQRLLDRVFTEVVETGHPDFPFCLCWANHSWYKKTWDPNKPNKLLIEQTYPGKDDYVAHFNEMLQAFKDERYMKINNKLIFGIYSPLDIPDFKLFKETWNKLAKENGLEGFYFWGFTYKKERIEKILNLGYNAVVLDSMLFINDDRSIFKTIITNLRRRITGYPNHAVNYSRYVDYTIKNTPITEVVHPSINPNFDHSPRSGNRGTILYSSTPDKWKKLLERMIKRCKGRQDNLIFIKAWNEWGEGNYLEPDLKFGTKYLEVTEQAIRQCKDGDMTL